MKIIAVDIGGTTIKSAVFIEGKFIDSYSVKTRGNTNRNLILEGVFNTIDRFFDKDVIYISISSAGNIDIENGKCVYATDNLKGWTGLEIKKIITEKYKVSTFVENDAICSLKGELANYSSLNDAVMLTLGTGVGGAAIIDNNIVHGNKFTGMRFGHMIIESNGYVCNCGSRGCVEQYISATALVREAKKYNSNIKNGKEIFDLYRNNDQNMKKVVDNFMYYFNVTINSINQLLDPSLIIIGGGISLARDIILEKLDKNIKNVVFAKYGDKSALYGAYIFATEELERKR